MVYQFANFDVAHAGRSRVCSSKTSVKYVVYNVHFAHFDGTYECVFRKAYE